MVEIAKREGTSINQFAVAEKISALNTEEFFAERRARADDAAIDRILVRDGGEPPREGDEFQFPFGDRAAIENLAKLYWESDLITPAEKKAEQKRIPAIVGAAKRRGYLLKDDLIEFGRWKSRKRNVWHYKKNSVEEIESITRKALTAKSREEALRHLEELKGVKLPTASAILHWFRDDVPIIDFRAVEALGYKLSREELRRKLRNRGKYEFYAEIADKIIREADRVRKSDRVKFKLLRKMDRALWAWQKAYARPRSGKACA